MEEYSSLFIDDGCGQRGPKIQGLRKAI